MPAGEAPARAPGSRVPVYFSIGANVVIAATKFAAAFASGSTAMAAEGLHSLIDSFDGSLLLVGAWRGRRPADESHPFGHGKEVYFWALIVALMFFTLGGVVSIYRGAWRTLHPEPLRGAMLDYIVLAIAALIDGASFVVGFRRFRLEAAGRGYWTFIKDSKDPTVVAVVLEDAADLLGIAAAALGVFASHQLHLPALDGVASIVIGIILCGMAGVLLVQIHGLLIGERADARIVATVRQAIDAEHALSLAGRPSTLQMGPGHVLLAIEIVLGEGESLESLAGGISRLESVVRTAHPEVQHVFVTAGTFRAWR